MTRQEFEDRVGCVKSRGHGLWDIVDVLIDALGPLLDDTRARDHVSAGIAGGETYTRTVTVGDGCGCPVVPVGWNVSGLSPAINGTYMKVEDAQKQVRDAVTTNNAAWSRALLLPPNIAWTPETGGKHVAEQMEQVGTMARADGVKDHARAMTDAHEAGKDIGEREEFERIMAILSKHRRAEAEKYEKANTAPVNAAMRRDAANGLCALVWAMKEIDPSIE